MSDRSRSLLVAPWFEIQSIRNWVETSEAVDLLGKYRVTLDVLLRNFLDSLQSIPCSHIRLGYMVAINVFDLFCQDPSGEWQFDSARMEFFTDLFLKVQRPVVV